LYRQEPPRLRRRERPLAGREMSGNFASYTLFERFLHASNLRHGTDGFTFPPKEGMLRIISS
jgi:hypothetical protein